MIVEEHEAADTAQTAARSYWSWLNIALSLIFVVGGGWYLLSRVTLAEIGAALLLAKFEYIALSVGIMIVTLLAKTWRWRWLLAPGEQAPTMSALFWSMMLGQFVNLLVPFLRLGEIARVYALHRQTRISRAHSLSTLVIEKTLDLVMLGITTIILFSVVVLPDFVGNAGLSLGLIALVGLLILYLLAYHTDLVVRLMRRVATFLPTLIGKQFMRLGVSGLEGLAALRDGRISAIILGLSMLIAFLSVVTPWALFPALDIELGLVEATLIHIVITLALVPPSTPGKVVVFDGAVAFLLVQLGIENSALVASYTIVFHLVILLPQLILGSVAASRTNWRWPRSYRNGMRDLGQSRP